MEGRARELGRMGIWCVDEEMRKANYDGLEWWLKQSLFERGPLDATEERVFANISLTIRPTAESLLGLFGH